MKTAVIIHRKPSKEEYYDPKQLSPSHAHWLPWIQKQLLLQDVVAQTPEMPVPYNPDYVSWREVFETFSLNNDTILIGHSCGAGFIVRYLSENNIKVGKVVLVAPWIDPEKSLVTGMFNFAIDENLVSKTAGIVLFSSTNDGESIKKSVKMLQDTVKNIRVIEFKDRGHFCHKDMPTDEFPELLGAVLDN